ncbi:hypothetical protein PILCRDRAFT_81698 [Piloderma croceum F 1598]|uniref:Uncharacterized protein n=1 Tax=Piloderma croceum (strain F 1598) TaxID=765440 RepID=A0A0C3EXJ6_PILCF|nr:hypothetical protein PILCRDRAFT_81698 [Piloderma croceum F 1598]
MSASEASQTQTHCKTESDVDLLDGPPPLPYSLYPRKKAIVITWSIIFFDSCLLPIIMFYFLWFTKLSHTTVLNILSSIFGLPSFIHFGKCVYYLCKKDSTCCPIGSKRGRLDYFQWSFSFSVLLLTGQIVAAVTPDPPVVPLFAMVTSTMLFITGAQLISAFFLYHARVKIPFGRSSLPAGHTAHPGIFTIIEDIVAVDGGGGTAYREALVARYDASPFFRRMLNRLDLFWGLGAFTTASIVTIMLWTIPVQIGYWIGWLVPFLWAGLWAFLTIRYVQSCLIEERNAW